MPAKNVALVVLLCSLVFPRYTAEGAEPGGALLFRDARVFDGALMLPRTSVLVEKGRITAVGPQLQAPDNARIIDARGKTLLPGLIDSHTHVFGPDVLRAALVFGVTTELDMFMSGEVLADIRKQLAAENGADMADLRSAGTLVTAPGGHGTEYGVAIPTLAAPDQAQAFVDARIAEGSDYIKIIYDDGKAFGLSFPTLSLETLKAAVTAAHARKKLAVVHIGSLQGARDAAEAGADGLEHLFTDCPPEADFGRFVASHHAFVTPTLTVLESVCGRGGGAALATDPAIAPFLSSTGRDDLGRKFPFRMRTGTNYAAAVESVRQLRAARVPLLAGTDAPNPGTTHGASLHRELELLVNAGLTPAEALAAATSVPAKQFGLADRGAIAPGKRADLLLVEGDPTADIKATRKIAGVWQVGVAVDRDAYRAELEKQRAAAKPVASSKLGTTPGLVSDFEDGKTSAAFGAGWQVSTDSLRGGKSKAALKVVENGAQMSKGALLVDGEVDGGLPYAWAGAIFFPGELPMSPADLSSKKQVSFWAKADGRTYSVMLFAPSRGFAPIVQTFVPGAEWKLFTFKLAQFDGYDGKDLSGLFIGAGLPAGKFALQIDHVKFE